MTKDEHEALQKAGANARAMGADMLANPFHKSDQSPRALGISVDEWSERHAAWQLGWTMENAMRD